MKGKRVRSISGLEDVVEVISQATIGRRVDERDTPWGFRTIEMSPEAVGRAVRSGLRGRPVRSDVSAAKKYGFAGLEASAPN